MSIAEISKQFHADKRGNCAMSVAYGYARAMGKSEDEAVKAAEMFRAFGGGKGPNKVIPCNRCVELAGEALDFLETK